MTTKTQSISGKPKESIRVLVVEDSPVNLQLALMQLQTLGYQADPAKNGVEAVERMREGCYDMILMDCQMPEMDGFEATWQIRHRENENAAQPGDAVHAYIIAMTADAAEDNREKCLAAGMNDYLQKPVQLPELEAALDRARQDPAALEAEEILDPMILAGLRLLRQPGKPDPVADLIKLFLMDTPERIEAIRQAVAANDMWSMSKIVAAATSLKGSASNLGARGLTGLCTRIEHCGRAGLLDEVSQLLAEAEAEYERVKQALEKIV